MPGSAGGRGRNPWHLTVLELLLQGYPGEFLPEWSASQGGGAGVREGTSDRQLMRDAAFAWMGSSVLHEDEKARIHAVWVDDEYLPPHNLDTARRDELRGMLHRAVA